MKSLFSILLTALIAFTLGWYSRGLISPQSAHDSAARSTDFPQAVSDDTHLLTSSNNDEINQDIYSQAADAPALQEDMIQQMLHLLKQRQYDEAVKLYEVQFAADTQGELSATLHHMMLNHLNKLYEDKQFSDLVSLANHILDSFYQDFSVWLFKAHAHIALEDNREAIDAFYQALNTSPDPEESTHIYEMIHGLAATEFKSLKKQQDWQALSDFSQHLLQQESGYFPYYLYYASSLIQLKDYTQAESYLTPLLDDPELSHIAQKLLSRIQALQAGASIVPLERSGSHFIASITIDHALPARLLLDTGASFSTMSPQLFNQLGRHSYSLIQNNITLSTANGKKQANLYSISSITIQNQTLHNVEFVVLDMNNSFSADGLLGMNILGQYQFQIDQDSRELILEPRH